MITFKHRVLVGVVGVAGAVVFAVTAASASSLVVNGDFSLGDNNFSSDYADYTPLLPTRMPGPLDGGGYVITPANLINTVGSLDWTTVSADPNGNVNGNVLVADGADANHATNRIWYQTVNVSANTLYTFSFNGVDLNTDRVNDATIGFFANGTLVGTPLNTNGGWQLASFDWNSGSATSVVLSLIDTNTNTDWNDFAIDLISFSQQTPLPAALPLFASGLGALGLLGWRRKRKAQATV